MWRFVQISDPHFAALSDGCGNNLLIHSLMPEVAICLKRDLKSLQPAFAIATGDLSASQSRDAVFAARDLLDSLGVSYYPVGGNQDFVSPASRDWFMDAYQARLPIQETVYSFSHRNLHFCVLDPWWQWQDGTLCPHRDGSNGLFQWSVPPHQLEWLRNDLEAHRGIHTIVAMHYPAAPLPGRLLRPRMLVPSSLSNGQLLEDFVRPYPQVIAFLSGHAHMHYIVSRNRLHHVVTGALSEYPVEYRVFDVHSDRVEIHTQGLSDKTFAARSLVHGNTWPSGDERDRSLVIPLRTAGLRTAV